MWFYFSYLGYMKEMLAFILFFLVLTRAGAQPCVPVQAPVLSEKTRSLYETKLAEALQEYKRDSTNADAIIWYGRRTAYIGDYIRAIEIFSRGIALHPQDARFYRHRGHRYITIRCFDKAIADFKKAAKLVKGKPDEVEPDGLPNAKNIPTSTLQSNIWYHLGLAYFVTGNYKKAVGAYEKGLKVSTHPDMYMAMANWMNISLRRLQKYKEAIALQNSLDPAAELIESRDYSYLIELYRTKYNEKILEQYATSILPKDPSLASATLHFGLGYYCLLYNQKEKARAYFLKAIASGQWASFGYIAAEAELNRESGVLSR